MQKLFFVAILIGIFTIASCSSSISRRRSDKKIDKALVFQNRSVLDNLLGDVVSKYLDAADKWHVEHAIINTPIGQEEVWLNHISGVKCLVRPLNDYTLHHKERCRYILVSVKHDNTEARAYPVFCFVNGAKWKIGD